MLLLLATALAAQPELTVPGPLLVDGRLVETGWARSPLKAYDREQVPGKAKAWDNFNIWTADHSLAVTVADVGRIGLVSVTWRDLTTGELVTERELIPFPRLDLPNSPALGHVAHDGERVDVSITQVPPGRRHLVIETGTLSADVWLSREPQDDSVVRVHPWAEGPDYFTYSVKQLPLVASGTVTRGAQQVAFTPETAFGVMDWGRSVRPREGTWRWGFGAQGGVGWNLGGGGPADHGWTQNVVVVDGVAHAFGPVTWTFDLADPDGPWRVRTDDGALDLVLTPRLSHREAWDLKVAATDITQAFGSWSGTIRLADGRVLEIRDAPGLGEEVYNRW